LLAILVALIMVLRMHQPLNRMRITVLQRLLLIYARLASLDMTQDVENGTIQVDSFTKEKETLLISRRHIALLSKSSLQPPLRHRL